MERPPAAVTGGLVRSVIAGKPRVMMWEQRDSGGAVLQLAVRSAPARAVAGCGAGASRGLWRPASPGSCAVRGWLRTEGIRVGRGWSQAGGCRAGRRRRASRWLPGRSSLVAGLSSTALAFTGCKPAARVSRRRLRAEGSRVGPRCCGPGVLMRGVAGVGAGGFPVGPAGGWRGLLRRRSLGANRGLPRRQASVANRGFSCRVVPVASLGCRCRPSPAADRRLLPRAPLGRLSRCVPPPCGPPR